MKKILFVLTFLCFGTAHAQDTLLFPPALELTFTQKDWGRIFPSVPSLEYGLISLNVEETQMKIECGTVASMGVTADSFARRFHIEMGQEHITEFTRDGIHILYFNPNEVGLKRIVFVYNDTYYAALRIKSQNKNMEETEAEVMKVINGLHFVTPAYIDKKIGYPLTGKNIDSLASAEEQNIISLVMLVSKKKLNGEKKYDKEKDDVVFHKMAEQTKVIMKRYAKAGFTYDRLYAIESSILNGIFPFDEWLDYVLLNKTDNDVHFFYTFGERAAFELLNKKGNPVFNKALSAVVSYPDSIKPEWRSESVRINKAGREFFWNYCELEKGMVVLCFEKQNNKWVMTPSPVKELREGLEFFHQSIITPDTARVKDQENSFENYNDVPQLGPDTGKFLILYNHWGFGYVANPNFPGTNFISIMSAYADVPGYDVTIKLAEPMNAGDRTTYFHPSWSYSSYIDSVLKGLASMEGLPPLLDSGKVYMDPYEVEQQAHDRLFENISPAKRIYFSPLVIGDINRNGIPDIYTFSVSNALLKSYSVFELTEHGVKLLEPSSGLEQQVTTSDKYKWLSEISLKPINDKYEFMR